MNRIQQYNSSPWIINKIIMITFGLVMTTAQVWAVPVTYRFTPINEGEVRGLALIDFDASTPFQAWRFSQTFPEFWSNTTDPLTPQNEIIFNGDAVLNTINTNGIELFLNASPPINGSGTYAALGRGSAIGTYVTTTSAIPEPNTLMLLSTGLLGLAGYRWSQRRRERLQVG